MRTFSCAILDVLWCHDPRQGGCQNAHPGTRFSRCTEIVSKCSVFLGFYKVTLIKVVSPQQSSIYHQSQPCIICFNSEGRLEFAVVYYCFVCHQNSSIKQYLHEGSKVMCSCVLLFQSFPSTRQY